MRYVTNKNQLPKIGHCAVLVFSSIYIPGDERSRTHPGHGYPETTEEVVKYIAFDTEQELTDWVAANETEQFVILNVSILQFKLEKKLKLTY